MFEKATSTEQAIGLATGDRAIKFTFTMKAGGTKSVTFDFYGNASDMSGKEFKEFESRALSAMARANLLGEVESFDHIIIKSN